MCRLGVWATHVLPVLGTHQTVFSRQPGGSSLICDSKITWVSDWQPREGWMGQVWHLLPPFLGQVLGQVAFREYSKLRLA